MSKFIEEPRVNLMEIQKLVEKISEGGTVTISDLKSLIASFSSKVALAKANRGIALTDAELKELAKDYKLAFKYACLKKEACPQIEPAIIKRGDRAFIRQYFTKISPKPNKLYEDWLLGAVTPLSSASKSAFSDILEYCTDILKARWPAGEKFLLDGLWISDEVFEMQKRLKIGRWPELEERLLFGFGKRRPVPVMPLVVAGRIVSSRSYRFHVMKKYFKNCGVGRHPDIEEMLLKKGKGLPIFLYATQCTRGKLVSPLHTKMILMGGGWSKRYLSWLERKKKSVDLYLQSVAEEISPESP